MKVSRLLHFIVPVIAMMISLSAAARAQEARGKFTLPYAVHCGIAMLPAGEYAYSVDLNSPTPMVTLRKFSPHAAGFMLMPSSSSEVNSSEPNRLVVEFVDGERVVSAMYMHELGVVFRYPVPHSKTALAFAAGGIKTQLAAKLTLPAVDWKAE
jgi:hypothetical protein